MIQEPSWSGTDGDPTKDGGFAVPVEKNTRMYRKLYNNVLMGLILLDFSLKIKLYSNQ